MYGLFSQLFNSFAGTLSFGVSFFVCFGLIRHKGKINIFSQGDKRRRNKGKIPLLGGTGIGLGFLAGSFTLVHQGELSLAQYFSLATALILSLVVGGIDDIYELRARWKFLAQNSVALLLIYATNSWDTPADNLLGYHSFLSYSLKWFWCLGILNSINLIDGLDGLAAGIGLLVLSFLCLSTQNSAIGHPLLFAAVPAILGFYVWNKHPAAIYMGEGGAQSISLFLFLATMNYRTEASPVVNVTIPLFALGLPIMDTLMAICRRIYRRVGIMSPDREHLHHRLLRLGISHLGVVYFLHIVTAYLCLVGYTLTLEEGADTAIHLLAISGLAINVFLLITAEQNLFKYLKSFSSHVIRLSENSDAKRQAIQFEIRMLREQQIPFRVFKLCLEKAAVGLLEQHPAKTQSFYENLRAHICNGHPNRKFHYENSVTATIVLLTPGRESAGEVKKMLLQELDVFERTYRLNLYLDQQTTLTENLDYLLEPESKAA